jgi:ubiquinone/menaquinone biosynthesis C-methylase UbiE
MEELTKQLCIGCGNNPTGSVNCDISIQDPEKHRGLHSKPINAKTTLNFVLCDALHLPFKDNCFESVFSAQVIEHLDQPLLFTREAVRVAKINVTIETMHRYGERLDSFSNRKFGEWYKSHHPSKFNFNWFLRAADVLGCVVQRTYVCSYWYFPHEYMPIFRFPKEIGVVIKK